VKGISQGESRTGATLLIALHSQNMFGNCLGYATFIIPLQRVAIGMKLFKKFFSITCKIGQLNPIAAIEMIKKYIFFKCQTL